LNVFFTMILREYVNKLKDFVKLANEDGYNLLSERTYLLPDGRSNKRHMIEAVINIFE